MKKFVILASAVVLTISAATAAYVFSHDPSSGLFEANIEALTDGEYDYSNGYPFSLQCNVSLGGLKRCKATVVTCQGGGSGCNERPCPMHR